MVIQEERDSDNMGTSSIAAMTRTSADDRESKVELTTSDLCYKSVWNQSLKVCGSVGMRGLMVSRR